MTIRRNLTRVLADSTDVDNVWHAVAGLAPPQWTGHALCAQSDPERWFPDRAANSGKAKAMCRVCPVAAQCLAYALENDEQHGIWGGLTELERQALTKAGVAS